MVRYVNGEKRQDYVKCPICGWTKTIETWRNRHNRYHKFSKNDIFIQVRTARGGKAGDARGSEYIDLPAPGFHVIEEESMTIKEASNSELFSDTVKDLKEQTINLVKLLIEEGILSLDELR